MFCQQVADARQNVLLQQRVVLLENTYVFARRERKEGIVLKMVGCFGSSVVQY